MVVPRQSRLRQPHPHELSRSPLRRRPRLSLPAVLRRRHLVELRRDLRPRDDREERRGARQLGPPRPHRRHRPSVPDRQPPHLRLRPEPHRRGDLRRLATRPTRCSSTSSRAAGRAATGRRSGAATASSTSSSPTATAATACGSSMSPTPRTCGFVADRRCPARPRCTPSSRTSSPSSATTRSTCAPSSRCSTSTARPSPHTTGGGVGIDTSQFALPLGNLLVTGGVGENQGMAIWAHQAAPDTRGPSVGFHIPRAGQTNYPAGAPITLLIHETLETPTIVNGTTFIVRPVGGAALAGRLTFAFDDVLTFTPDQPLAANTTYEVRPAGRRHRGRRRQRHGRLQLHLLHRRDGERQHAAESSTSFAASPYPAAPGESVAFAATAIEPQGDAVEYRFDFGDGSPKTAWGSRQRRTTSSPPPATTAPPCRRAIRRCHRLAHAASSPSRCAPAGAVARREHLGRCATPPPAASGRSNPDHDTVAALDADSATLELETAVCAEPRGARPRRGRRDLGRLRRRRPRAHSRRRRLAGRRDCRPATAARRRASSPRPTGATLYVALEGRGELRRIDAASRQTTATLALGSDAARAGALGRRRAPARHPLPLDRDWGEVWDVATADARRSPARSACPSSAATPTATAPPTAAARRTSWPASPSRPTARTPGSRRTSRTSSAARSSAPTSIPTTRCGDARRARPRHRHRRARASTSTTATRRRRSPSRRSATTSS